MCKVVEQNFSHFFSIFIYILFCSNLFKKQDAHINSILTLLNATNQLDQVPFATALIFELRQDSSGLYYIQLIMQKNSTAQPFYLQPINIDSCNQLCPLGNFFDITGRRMLPTSLRDACFADNNGGYGYPTTTQYPPCKPTRKNSVRDGLSMLELGLIIGCSILAAFVLGLLFMICCICYRNRIRKESF